MSTLVEFAQEHQAFSFSAEAVLAFLHERAECGLLLKDMTVQRGAFFPKPRPATRLICRILAPDPVFNAFLTEQKAGTSDFYLRDLDKSPIAILRKVRLDFTWPMFTASGTSMMEWAELTVGSIEAPPEAYLPEPTIIPKTGF